MRHPCPDSPCSLDAGEHQSVRQMNVRKRDTQMPPLNRFRQLVCATAIAGLATSIVGCGADQTRLKSAAELLSMTADRCMQDVRDRQKSYENSQNCVALGPLASAYIKAGGFTNEPAEIRLIAETARVYAWMARAASLPGGRGVSIW